MTGCTRGSLDLSVMWPTLVGLIGLQCAWNAWDLPGVSCPVSAPGRKWYCMSGCSMPARLCEGWRGGVCLSYAET